MKIDFTFGLAARIRDWFRPKAALASRISGRSLPAGETAVYRFGVFGPTVTAIDAGPENTPPP